MGGEVRGDQFILAFDLARQTALDARAIVKLLDRSSFVHAWLRASNEDKQALLAAIRISNLKVVQTILDRLTEAEPTVKALRQEAKSLGIDYVNHKTKEELQSEIHSKKVLGGTSRG